MKFTIITHAEHKLKDGKIFAYEPYVKEMNLWLKFVEEVVIIAPVSRGEISEIDSSYNFKTCHPEPVEGSSNCKKASEKENSLQQAQADKTIRHSEFNSESFEKESQMLSVSNTDKIRLVQIASFNITSFKNSVIAIFKIPEICIQIYKAMQRADHIHLRCPGNIGLLGCIVQILFPSKPKTVKYAGNGDPKSKQPLSYRFQKWLLSNTFLTRNCKVLVYGKWPNQSKNIVPFFTASYSEEEIEDVEIRDLHHNKLECHPEPIEGNSKIENNILKFIFVGGLTPGKQPLLSVQVIHKLVEKGFNVNLAIYGDGVERWKLENYISENNLKNQIHLFGNQPKNIVKEAYKKSHFLLFISKSEGWPKVVAESMFWGCLPISSNVSCVPEMLGNGTRGAIVSSNIEEIVKVIESYLTSENKYKQHAKTAMQWSRQFTLEKFENEIGKLISTF